MKTGTGSPLNWQFFGISAGFEARQAVPMVRCWFFASVLLGFALLCTGQSSNTSSLDSIIRDYAFKALFRRRTGVLYQVPLPADLSGIKASVIRLRGRSLWNRGSDSGSFHIPQRIITVPFVRRLVIVYQDLGNWSSSYYNVPGYSLLAPVVGCLVYDASNTSSGGIRELGLRALGDHISIIFPDLLQGLNSMAKCATLGGGGSVHLGEMASSNVCLTDATGHFTVVASTPVVAPAPAPAPAERGGRRWWFWVACGGGIVGLVLVGLVGVWILMWARNKKMGEMESKADGGEALGGVRIGSSVIPSAAMMRTQPVLENGSAPW